MADKRTIEKINSIQAEFASRAYDQRAPIDIFNGRSAETLAAYDYNMQVEALKAAAECLARDDQPAALAQIKKANTNLWNDSVRRNNMVDNQGRFSSERRILKDEAEEMQKLSGKLGDVARAIQEDQQLFTLARASGDPEMLIRSVKGMQENLHRNSDWGNIRDLADLLILSAETQLRQQKQIEAMARRIVKLEEKLAEQEKPAVLDKPKHPSPKR